jgi:hypothetical protein
VRRILTVLNLGCLAFTLSCGDKGSGASAGDGDGDGDGDTSESGTGETGTGTGDGDGDGDGDGEGTFTTTMGSTTFTTGNMEYECPNGEFPPGLPSSVMGNSMDGYLMMNDSPCSNEGANGQELVYTFTAPEEGFYEFDTVGSMGDTVLHLREETCEGEIFACGDDLDFEAMITQSVAGAFLAQDEVIQVVVDHKIFAADAAVVANVKKVDGTCPEETIMGSLPITVMGDTTGKTNKITGSCFGEGPDITYAWTAPEDGSYRIETDTCPYQMCMDGMMVLYDTVLYVLDGTTCGGDELACNDDVALGMERDSRLTVDLTAGQDVIIVVDGWSNTEGQFDLKITKI